MNVEKLGLIYEGKAKKVYETSNRNLLIQEFKDDATAFNAQKKGTIIGKGIINNKISAKLFELLEEKAVPTHFVRLLSDKEMLVKRLEIIPVEVTIRNIVAGGMAKMLALEEGIILPSPVLEYHYKNDSLGDPLINDYHIRAINLASDEEMRQIKEYSFKVDTILSNFFDAKELDLVDFKLEFGRHKNEILLGDEISPDTCRLWEKGTKKKLDKDRFRRDLGDVEEAYQEVLRRVVG